MGAGGCGGIVGGGESALPGGEIVLEEVFLNRGAGRGGVGQRPENVGDRAAGEFVVVGDILPKGPRVGGGGGVVPPAGKGGGVERGAARGRVFEAVTEQRARVKGAVGLRELGEEGGEVFEEETLGGGELAAEFRGEDGRPVLAEGNFFGRGRGGVGGRRGRRGEGREGDRGFRVRIGRRDVLRGGGEPREGGGVDVHAVGAAVAGAAGRPFAAGEEEGDEEFFLIGDVGLDVVVGVAAEGGDLTGLVAGGAALADRFVERAHPRAQGREGLRRFHATDDLVARFGGHGNEERGRRRRRREEKG